MIIGLKNWNATDGYYTQTNNAVESILSKTGANRKLESCGPESCANILTALGVSIGVKSPGGWEIQPGDLLTMWFNDPRNYEAMRWMRSDVDPATYMGNEVPQWYPEALKHVFGVESFFSWGMSENIIIEALTAERGILATLKNPGHYIGIIAYDTEARETIYHDPWPGNKWPTRYAGKPGAFRRMTIDDLNNVQPWRIEISGVIK